MHNSGVALDDVAILIKIKIITLAHKMGDPVQRIGQTCLAFRLRLPAFYHVTIN